MNIYDLSRHFWNYSFENPDKIKPQHSAIYFYAIEVCNRLGWKEKFGFPSAAAMEATGIKSHNTFTKRLNELVDMGLIKMIERSKNQYTANVIALSKFAKAHDKALDRHCIKHLTGTVQSTDSINKPINNSTNTQINKECMYEFYDLWNDYDLGGRAKGSKKQALAYWNKLSVEDREAAVETMQDYLSQAKGKDGKSFGKQVKYYLRDKEWEGVEAQSKNSDYDDAYQKCIHHIDAKRYFYQIKNKVDTSVEQLAKDYLHACKVRDKKLNPYDFPGWISRNEAWIIENYKKEQ